MTIKDILVHLDESEQSETRMGIALGLAKAHDARLTANYTAVYELGDEREEALAAPEETFRKRTTDVGLDSDFCGYFGEHNTIMALNAKLSKVVIAGTFSRHEYVARGRTRCCCIGATGGKHSRFEWTFGVGKARIACLEQTREASRAVADAMPILEKADEVIVVTVHAPATGVGAAGDFLGYLSRHDVNAKGHHEVAPDTRIGEALVEAAEHHEADLIVMGAYGHSRLREVAFGGATRHVLGHTAIPVLMSH